MKIGVCGAVLAAVVAGLAAFFIPAPGHAATWGHAQWCAVTDAGGGNLMWECVYDSAAECQPFIIAGSHGFCSVNPYWKGPDQSHQSDDD